MTLPVTHTLSVHGKSRVCKAAKVLLCDVTKFVQMEDSGNIKISELPKKYEPFHEDVDIESRLPQKHANQNEDTTVRKVNFIADESTTCLQHLQSWEFVNTAVKRFLFTAIFTKGSQ